MALGLVVIRYVCERALVSASKKWTNNSQFSMTCIYLLFVFVFVFSFLYIEHLKF